MYVWWSKVCGLLFWRKLKFLVLYFFLISYFFLTPKKIGKIFMAKKTWIDVYILFHSLKRHVGSCWKNTSKLRHDMFSYLNLISDFYFVFPQKNCYGQKFRHVHEYILSALKKICCIRSGGLGYINCFMNRDQKMF